MAAELNDVIQLLRMRREKQRGENFADECAHHGKRQRRAARVPALLLKKRIGDRRQDDVSVPARICSPFEVVEAEFVFELLILLLDGPSLMRDPDESLQRGGHRKMNEEILGDC